MPLTLNGTTGIAGVDGTASTPAVRGGDTNTGFVFGTDIIQVIEGGAESARFDASGNLLVGVTSANANGGVLQLKSGITFPATQSQSSDVNTLDDYEEGTWTPNLLISSSSTGITYSSRNGTYTKIGNTVRCTFGISLSNKGSNTGGINVTNLPFTPSNSTDARNIGVAAFEGATSSFPAACVWALFYDDGRVYLRYQSASTFSDILGIHLTNTTVIYVTCVYLTTQ